MGSVMGAGAGAGFGGGAVDPIAAAVAKYGGFLNDPDFAGALTLNTQPDTTGDWAGAEWAGSGLGPYTHTADVGHTAGLDKAILLVGNRYQTVFTVSDRTAGSVTYYAGTTAGTARSTNATFTEDLTCAGTTSHLFVPSADFDGVVTVVSVTNLSITTTTPKTVSAAFAGLTFTQATAAEMGWKASTTLNGKQPIQCYEDDNARGDAAAAAFTGINKAWTVLFVVKQSAQPPRAAKTTFFWGASNAGATSRMDMGILSTGQIYLDRETAGTWKDYTGPAGDTNLHVYAARFNGSTLRLLQDGTELVAAKDFALAGDVAVNKFLLNSGINTYTRAGANVHGDFVCLDGSATDAEITDIGKVLATKWGGTWA